MDQAIISRTVCCLGVTEWAVMIGYFLVCVHSNHTRNCWREKAVNGAISKFQPPGHSLAMESGLAKPVDLPFFVVNCEVSRYKL